MTVSIDEMTIESGTITTLLAPSGSGKTTFLKILAGLYSEFEGRVSLFGLPPRLSNTVCSIVFQDVDAYPWMTVRENIELLDDTENTEGERVDKVLADLGLSEAESKYPWQLSAGMSKRLALGRALVKKTKLLLLDEAFTSLDVATKIQMWSLIKEKVSHENMTALVITHDIEEAVELSDSIVIASGPPLSSISVLTGDDIDSEAIRTRIILRSQNES